MALEVLSAFGFLVEMKSAITTYGEAVFVFYMLFDIGVSKLSRLIEAIEAEVTTSN